MTTVVGFVVNPIAGMGGKVGLKGTDGILEQAIQLGAKPIASTKALETLKDFKALIKKTNDVQWITCTGTMGENELKNAGFTKIKTVYTPKKQTQTTADDTKNACRQILNYGIDLLVFCGGDGTARDIFEVVEKRVPLFGIPSGVKMHSGVFGVTTTATAKILYEFLKHTLTIGDVEIMDVDEGQYRKGVWSVKLFGIAQGIVEPTFVQVGKTSYESVSDDEVKDELAEHIHDEMEQHPDTLYVFGSGGTIEYIAKKLGFENTLLGVDAVYKNNVVGKDLNEDQILILLKQYQQVKLILSPIGAQGFILGRGNLQLSPAVIRTIGIENIIVVATPSKIAGTPILRVDTGEKKLDALFTKRGFFMVVIGYRLSRVIHLQTNNF